MRGAKQKEMSEKKADTSSYVPLSVCLVYSYIRRPLAILGVQNFEFQYFWGGLENRIFLGYEDCVDIFWGSSQNWTVFGGISMHFRVFSEGQGTEWRIFLGL